MKRRTRPRKLPSVERLVTMKDTEMETRKRLLLAFLGTDRPIPKSQPFVCRGENRHLHESSFLFRLLEEYQSYIRKYKLSHVNAPLCYAGETTLKIGTTRQAETEVLQAYAASYIRAMAESQIRMYEIFPPMNTIFLHNFFMFLTSPAGRNVWAMIRRIDEKTRLDHFFQALENTYGRMEKPLLEKIWEEQQESSDRLRSHTMKMMVDYVITETPL